MTHPDRQAEALESRLIDVETRLAFQEQALTELSDALAASRADAARYADILRRALDDLKQMRVLMHADASDETPPPHW